MRSPGRPTAAALSSRSTTTALRSAAARSGPGPGRAALPTVGLASGVTEKVATGKIWLPVTWDRAAMLVAAGVTGPGGYLTGYDVIDLSQQPHPRRSPPFRPTLAGRLKASGDAHDVLLSATVEGGRSSLLWWPIGEPE